MPLAQSVEHLTFNQRVEGSSPVRTAILLYLVEKNKTFGSVAQLVEQRTENPCVGGSIPSRATINIAIIHLFDYTEG